MKFIIKIILKFFGLELIKFNPNVYRINSQHFIPIKKKDKDWKINLEGFKRSKNIYDDFLTKIRFYSMTQLVKYIIKKNKIYDFVEAGCWRGHSSYIIAEFIKKKNITFHIFDSFEGLSSSSPKDGNFFFRKDRKRIEQQFASDEFFVKNTVLKKFDFVKSYKGWIPSRFKEVENKKFSFVHIDLVLYKPTLDTLKFFYPRLVKGGVIVSNVYNSSVFPGEKRAWDEYFKKNKKNFFFKHALNQCFLIKN
jgi:hypothetical protein